MSAPQGLAARRAALALLQGVFRDGLTFADQERAVAKLEPAERAAAGRLAVETVRHLGPVDAVLDRFVKKRPPEPARSALRLGAYEICAQGAAAHGVVNALVAAMRKHPKGRHQAGLVNAVLRKVGEAGAALEGLSAVPEPLREAFVESYGADRVVAMEAVFAQRPPVDVSLRAPGEAARWAEALEADVLPTGSLRLAAGRAVSGLPGFEDGAWWVQDAAAAVPVMAMGDVAGCRVVDMCAAPGGKTLQLAARGAEVVAVDASAGRMARLEENLRRVGLASECVVADVMDWAPDGPVDAVLLDAPCTATGTLRRHPELPYARDGFDPALPGLQAEMLAQAAGWLAPGGRLVFATCSLLEEEGEAHMAGAEALGLTGAAFDVPGIGASQNGALRLTPEIWAERGGMDGFFVASFKKV